jgi:hypothetical protein
MEVSEKVEITNEGKRLQMFKDAAAQGDDVLNKLRDQGSTPPQVSLKLYGDEDTASRGSSHLAREAMGQKE